MLDDAQLVEALEHSTGTISTGAVNAVWPAKREQPASSVEARRSIAPSFFPSASGAGAARSVLDLRQTLPPQCIEPVAHGLQLLGWVTDPVDQLAHNPQGLAGTE